MRNFKYFFLIIGLCNFFLYSQYRKGIVTYKQRLISNKVFSTDSIKGKKVNGNFEQFNNVLKKNSNKFEYNLSFKNNESYYKREINFEKDINKFAIILTGGNDEYYQDLLKKTKIKKLNAYGEEFNVLSSLVDEEWTLINETKKIEGYICYKATSFKTIKNGKEIFKKNVIAWYAPSLPYNFGPKGYGGLPGLILELNEDKIQYYAAKIILNPSKKIEIIKPSKGKLVTVDEFDEVNYKMTRRYRERYKKMKRKN
jgi:GLPGLI family protein